VRICGVCPFHVLPTPSMAILGPLFDDCFGGGYGVCTVSAVLEDPEGRRRVRCLQILFDQREHVGIVHDVDLLLAPTPASDQAGQTQFAETLIR
jgi:hypothetical protein